MAATRREFLFAAASASALAQDATTAYVNIDIHRLSRKMFAVAGNGGNMLVAVTGEGLLLVDSGLAEHGAQLAATLAHRLADAPVHAVINTHWHSDHVGGNVALGQAGARIIAHANTRKHLSQRTKIDFLNQTFEPLAAPGMPKKKIIAKTARLQLGTTVAEITPHAPAHTDGDLHVFFPNENILHSGDLLSTGMYPTIDYSTGGWLGGLVEAGERLLKLADAKTAIVPGHGRVGTRADLEASYNMLIDVMEKLEGWVKDGVALAEAVDRRPTARFDAAWGAGVAPELFVRTAYNSLLRHDGVKA